MRDPTFSPVRVVTPALFAWFRSCRCFVYQQQQLGLSKASSSAAPLEERRCRTICYCSRYGPPITVLYKSSPSTPLLQYRQGRRRLCRANSLRPRTLCARTSSLHQSSYGIGWPPINLIYVHPSGDLYNWLEFVIICKNLIQNHSEVGKFYSCKNIKWCWLQAG